MRRSLLALAGLVCALLTALPAGAHQRGRSYCSVHTVVGGVDVSVETSFEHLAQVLGTPRDASDELIRSKRQELARALERSVQGRTSSGDCTFSPGELELVTSEGQRAARMSFELGCAPEPVTLRNTWRFDVDATSEVVCSIDGDAWVFRPGSEERGIGTPPSVGQVLASFVNLGVHHVLSGIDHVLFVVALLLAAARGSREQKLGTALRRVALVVTGFTLGHSLTLVAAGLGWVRVEPRITESIIAFSIVVVAVENVVKGELRWRGLTASLFGLVHGFGFASVLTETELPRRARVLSLLAFNVGIELGQLFVVLVVFVPLYYAARRASYERRLLAPASLVIAALASIWCVKRAFELGFLPWLGG
ncbi:MAG: HupE/UreJ family protein [Polyangiaceae bacterium]